jgi:hypothetical protein
MKTIFNKIHARPFSILGFLGIFFMLLQLTACGVYTQSGASIHPDAKTFSVDYITNNASIVAPSLSQTLTEKIKTKFINETPLKLTTGEGDLHFSGKITSYVTAPVAIQGNQTNAVSRLTVIVEITCDNQLEESKSFTQTFTNFTDFDSSLDFAGIERDLINKICDGMVQDIFNKAFINW